jgi:hypothetical protein
MTRGARWFIAVGTLLVLLSVGLLFAVVHSATCFYGTWGCTEDYRIGPWGWTVGPWFQIVEGAIVVGAFLFLLTGAGWLFQIFMENRERRKLNSLRPELLCQGTAGAPL